MIDFSHANSQKDPQKQLAVADNVAQQLRAGEARIMGVMIESNLKAGRQDLVAGKPLEYGKSITDACISFDDTQRAVEILGSAVRQRRLNAADTDA